MWLDNISLGYESNAILLYLKVKQCCVLQTTLQDVFS